MEIIECEKCGGVLTPQSECGCMSKDYLYAVNYIVSVAMPGDYEEEE